MKETFGNIIDFSNKAIKPSKNPKENNHCRVRLRRIRFTTDWWLQWYEFPLIKLIVVVIGFSFFPFLPRRNTTSKSKMIWFDATNACSSKILLVASAHARNLKLWKLRWMYCPVQDCLINTRYTVAHELRIEISTRLETVQNAQE